MTMPELRKIIEGLSCFLTNQHPCGGCPWNPSPGMAWPYGCVKGQREIIEAARERLELDDSLEDDLK